MLKLPAFIYLMSRPWNRTALTFLFTAVAFLPLQAQTVRPETADSTAYRGTATKINALVHTKLQVKFDYTKKYLIGKEWLTLKPYAYATDSLTLDAKGMDIRSVALVEGGTLRQLKYSYDQEQLRIQLGKSFAPGQNYVVFIDYTAKPDELKTKGSAAITDAKGLYFINPDSAVKGKPVQIWTQGETESSSAWFPTIDKPNQKTTAEISITAPARYVTLSNGKLASQVKNADGTRTDTWKMDLPHSPYLFMMAVGNFRIYKDKWKEKEVNYYLEPAYAPYARQIFGNTPEMIGYFSKLLGVDYPWNKYSQIVVRDYVSGAMENTTATLHGDFVQRTPREMLDEHFSQAESTIAHELFHQWFGDYVTAESWSNLTVNESFANYSEVLWAEHKYGKDAADEHNYEDMQQYLGSEKDVLKNLVRFHYSDKEEVFDAVSYQKGGRILHMLRSYLGDAVFFKGLNIYLKQNAFRNGEAHQLRLALEEASGQDLNWFFNQWYFQAGHPQVQISYNWDASSKSQKVTLKQIQQGQVFTLPLDIDLYSGGSKKRFSIIANQREQTFSFDAPAKPELVNVDARKITLWQKEDQKGLAEFAVQYARAPLYTDRLEAITAAGKEQQTAEGRQLLIRALDDKYHALRLLALDSINFENAALLNAALPKVRSMALGDPSNIVKAKALELLGARKDAADLPLFRKSLESQSYAVQAAGLMGLAMQNDQEALDAAKKLEKDHKKQLTSAIIQVYAKSGGTAEVPFVVSGFSTMGAQDQVSTIPAFLAMAMRTDDMATVRQIIDTAKQLGLKYKQYGIHNYVTKLMGQLKQAMQGKTEAVQYIDKTIQELQ